MVGGLSWSCCGCCCCCREGVVVVMVSRICCCRVLLSCRGVVVVAVERVSWVCCYGCEVAIVGVGEL